MKYRVLVYILIAITILTFKKYGRSIWVPVYYNFTGRKTVEEVISTHQADVKNRLEPLFSQHGISFPPDKIRLVGNKSARRIDLYAMKDDHWIKIKGYKFTGYSGLLGPKLREGDGQIPEGIYSIKYLNPNSRYHLSMKLNYPNAFDKEMGRRDGRTKLGTDIFIHGNNLTIGCIPIGDRNIEELFVLTALTGKDNVSVIITPYDFISDDKVKAQNKPAWIDELYNNIRKELQRTQGS